MDQQQRIEVEQNYDSFQRSLNMMLADHRDQFALMHHREVVAYFGSAGEAYRAGRERFGEAPFSIQEVTDEPIDLGFWSHVRI